MSRSLRVLYVSDVYFPRVNGVSTSIRSFRGDLAACGIETVLVAPDYGVAAAEDPGGGPVVRVPSVQVPGDPEDRRMRWPALRRTLAALPGRFDLVHVQTPFIAHYAGVRRAREAGVPCIATYHTYFEEYLHHYVPALPRSLGRRLARAFTRSQCAQLASLVAPSEPMREILTDYGVRTPVHVLPTGLPADRFQPGDRAAFRARHGIGADTPLLTYVGRVAHEKNIDFLLRMFVTVRAARPGALLLIAGEGPAREALRARVGALGLEGSVRFAGYLDRNSELLDCYAAADVFVFASRTETQGLVLLEAMAQRVPVVAIAELGTRSVLGEASGAIVAPEAEGEFAAAVLRVLSEPALRETLRGRAIDWARTWSSAAMATRLAALYRSLVPQG